MKKLSNIFESIIEDYDRNMEEYYTRVDDFQMNVLMKFLHENNDDYTAYLPWRLVPFNRLKRIWEQHAQFGFVRDEKGLETIKETMISNTIKIHAITIITGHTPINPDDVYEDAWGQYVEQVIKSYIYENNENPNVSRDPDQLEFNYNNQSPDGKKKVMPEVKRNDYLYSILDQLDTQRETPQELKSILFDKLQEKLFWYYLEDPKSGQLRISDYGLEPLQKLALKLMNAYGASEKITLIDKMLNVVHQRSDLASWFVEGGSNALSDLSASPEERKTT